MADLSAVLKKTIDALPSASPQLRAKVYEKARAAIARQIASADPPLPQTMVEARQRALEEAIAATEAHYAAGEGGPVPAAPVAEAPRQPSPPPPAPRAPAAAPPPPPRRPEPTPPPPARPVPDEDEARPAVISQAEHRAPVAPPAREEPLRSTPPAAGEPRRVPPPQAPIAPKREASPLAPPEPIRETEPSEGSLVDDIPEADLAAPAYARRRAKGARKPLYTSLAALLFIGGLGAAGYFYSDEIAGALSGREPEVASLPAEEPTAEPGAQPPAEEGEATEPDAAGTAPDPSSRQFTQRLLPDGSETDEGPAQSTANVFDEGTDVAAASPILTPEPPAAESVSPPAADAAGEDGVPVGQRAVFYEERSASQPGSQHVGNVVWSIVNEPPAAGQPPEPAVRAQADITETGLRLTMTIRRNADATLPASHVIELLFDTPADFAGGAVENVQRLALKPTEQARGEPLIGVAGKISDDFFIIALNDLQQAVDNNLSLMANEQWIDIPLAYTSGQRALMSLEKGIPGERVFREALDAWATRS
ncbi:hypothetical protein [Aureimonas populi]|uniref:Transcriptional regulator n=1 Tax=Aureimonas populi TaxID=1701758 RepID=A0ABW5CFT7_9HYPH|nr:hypothetical protein [Aureimonas populi]